VAKPLTPGTEMTNEPTTDLKASTGKALILADALEEITSVLDDYIITNFGGNEAWENNVGITKDPETEGVFAHVWNCRELANSALHWIKEISDEDAIDYFEQHH
jgi:hypothetical protein